MVEDKQSYAQAISAKDDEIQKLSEQVQAMEAQLKEQPTTTDEAMEGEPNLRVVDLLDVKVQLSEAKIVRQEMEGKVEAVLERQKEMALRMEALEIQFSVS